MSDIGWHGEGAAEIGDGRWRRQRRNSGYGAEIGVDRERLVTNTPGLITRAATEPAA